MAKSKSTTKGDFSGATEFLEDLSQLEGEVSLGYVDPETSQIALYNEFGTKHIPARPYLRRGVAGDGTEYDEILNQAVEGEITPPEFKEYIGQIGVAAVISALDTTTSWATPNAPSTIKKKGHATPLIESRDRLRDITYEVD